MQSLPRRLLFQLARRTGVHRLLCRVLLIVARLVDVLQLPCRLLPDQDRRLGVHLLLARHVVDGGRRHHRCHLHIVWERDIQRLL